MNKLPRVDAILAHPDLTAHHALSAVEDLSIETEAEVR